MIENTIKKIATSCQFPMNMYKVTVKYNEVRKASGIAYILLELIQKSASSSDVMKNTLLKFGIPEDLHYLFRNELYSLALNGIVECDFNVSYIHNPQYFAEMRIKVFRLTHKGRKMFAEGAIPTGEEKAKTPTLFFSPVTRKFSTSCTLPYATLESSFLGENFMDKVEYDISGMEDYVRSVQTTIGLKKEEMIVSVEAEEPKLMVVKQDENMTIELTADSVKYVFATSDEQAFFNKYYSSDLITSALLMKDKYKFNGFKPKTVRMSELGDINAFYIPSDMKKQAARPCKIFLNKGEAGVERADNVIQLSGQTSNELLSKLSELSDFALMDQTGCRYYLPVNVIIPCQQFGDELQMQLLVEKVATETEFKLLLENIYRLYETKAFSSEVGQVIAYTVSALKDYELLRKFATMQIMVNGTFDSKVDVLLKMNSAFAKLERWTEIFKQLSDELYVECVKNVGLENTIFMNTILTPLKKAIGMSDMDYIRSFAGKMKENENAELVYEALSAAGFETAEILGVVNVVGVYAEEVIEREPMDGTTELADGFRVLSVNLWKLCDMVGVDNYADYTIKDDFNVDAFFDLYSTFNKSMKAVEKYRSYAKEPYAILDRYLKIFEPIHEILAIEKTASSHPEKITRKYIDEEINRGKYKDAICDLLIKVQYDLRALLNAENTVQANELIDRASMERMITRDQERDLHQLRMCRNGFQHPERRQIPYDKNIIANWADIVFAIKGETK